MNRHLSRIIAMQSLYEWDFRGTSDLDEITARNMEHMGENADEEFIYRLVNGVKEKAREIDEMIVRVAPEWPLDQISVVDKTILRIAILELLFNDEVPPKVAINEAVELGKTFGGENSSKFINGVLGTLYRRSDRYKEEDEVEMKDDDEQAVGIIEDIVDSEKHLVDAKEQPSEVEEQIANNEG